MSKCHIVNQMWRLKCIPTLWKKLQCQHCLKERGQGGGGGGGNVRHSHVILTIRNTHIFSKQPSTKVKKLIRVSRIYYIAKTVQRSYPSLVSGFICMFHLFMKFTHLRVYSCQPCFFLEYGTHTRPSASQNMTILN